MLISSNLLQAAADYYDCGGFPSDMDGQLLDTWSRVPIISERQHTTGGAQDVPSRSAAVDLLADKNANRLCRRFTDIRHS